MEEKIRSQIKQKPTFDPEKNSEEQILEMLMDEEQITWRSLLFELIKTEQMDPWNINISQLSQRYLKAVENLKEHNFRVSGKVILAAAILLRIKSHKLLDEDIENLDRLIKLGEEDLEELGEEFFEEMPQAFEKDKPEFPALSPRLPQPRVRKVSVYDLVNALQKALEVKQRRVNRQIKDLEQIEIPKKKIDIGDAIKDIYLKIRKYLSNKPRVTFSQLVNSENKEDKVYTFIPLLHLSNQRRVELEQEDHFGEIDIYLLKGREEEKKENKAERTEGKKD